MTLEKKAVLVLTKKEREFLEDFYYCITDEFDSIDFSDLLSDITCKMDYHKEGGISIDIQYKEEEN